ncbi:ATPase family associated with various cellular activities (AAA) [Rubripirellula lacrimiformis]|uniref:ATPase family associated with various cellular activities (AAA) n=1 Tax=Rubripirellula lacrimiformis TaxID=1930273 RepID=A0A517N627_9BACT|nr:MoxR family ATPase [Rubripirellula lacrimiformis]QDT02595.1 ATPase family associated with various cellular activities (AAA) [Rubripirellula lacrimiformis]
MTESIDNELRDRLEQFRGDFARLRDEVSKRIVGQQPIVDGVLTSLIAGGHVLLEGVPGLGKTLLVRTLSEVLEAPFGRIQFTPDLMPADLIGTNILVETQDGRKEFQFQRGPIFANVVLADEINRATPKTQSALLEAMQEHSVTVAGVSHQLDGLFFVLATQNPLEMEGTYPLPEAQLDRFLMKLVVPFPTTTEMESIMDRTTAGEIPPPDRIMSADRILELRQLSRQIPIADEVRRYAILMIMGTHPTHEAATDMVRRFVRYGSSPRGAQALILCAKIRAVLDGRYHVAKEDIRDMAHATLRHRVMLNFEGQAEGVSVDAIIDNLVENVRDEALVG